MRFTIMQEPVAKGRPRITKSGHAYTPTNTLKAELDIKNQIIRQMGERGYEIISDKMLPLQAYYKFIRSRPKSLPKKYICPVQKPDLSNLLKTVEDAMNGIVYPDDSQIVATVMTKEYGYPPRIEVLIEECEIKLEDIK